MAFRYGDIKFIAGFFNSFKSFGSLEYSPERIVETYEVEFYFEECTTYIDGIEYKLPRGSVLRTLPGAVRYSKMPMKNCYLKFVDENDDFSEFIKKMPIVFASENIEFYRLCILEYLEGKTKNNKWKSMKAILSIFSALQNELEKVIPIEFCDKKHSKAVAEAISYMNENLNKKCVLEDIAASVHFSPIYFHTMFKKITGRTPQEYLTDIRLEKSKFLLVSGSDSIADIAEECGFSSETYFSAVFKKRFSITPRAYRKQTEYNYWNELN